MMDWIPNRLVYDPKISCSPSTCYGSASLASMGCFSRIRKCLKLGGLR